MKLKSTVFLLFLCFNTIYASDWIAELRAGYFYPTSQTFRDIYKSGGVEGEFEIAAIFKQNWIAFGNVSYFPKTGSSIGFNDKTTISMVPLSLGFKYQFLVCNPIQPYLGGGVTYTFLDIKNYSDYVKKHVHKSGFGFVIKSGAYVNLSERFLLDLFLDYYYQQVNFYTNHHADVGGLRMGAGLGCRF